MSSAAQALLTPLLASNVTSASRSTSPGLKTYLHEKPFSLIASEAFNLSIFLFIHGLMMSLRKLMCDKESGIHPRACQSKTYAHCRTSLVPSQPALAVGHWERLALVHGIPLDGEAYATGYAKGQQCFQNPLLIWQQPEPCATAHARRSSAQHAKISSRQIIGIVKIWAFCCKCCKIRSSRSHWQREHKPCYTLAIAMSQVL